METFLTSTINKICELHDCQFQDNAVAYLKTFLLWNESDAAYLVDQDKALLETLVKFKLTQKNITKLSPKEIYCYMLRTYINYVASMAETSEGYDGEIDAWEILHITSVTPNCEFLGFSRGEVRILPIQVGFSSGESIVKLISKHYLQGMINQIIAQKAQDKSSLKFTIVL